MDHENWGTQSEIAYLQKIGVELPRYRLDRQEPDAMQMQRLNGLYAERQTLLKKYIAAADLRTNWGGIDAEKVLAHARSMLTPSD